MVADTVVDFEDFEAASIGDSIFDGDANGFEWFSDWWCTIELWDHYGSYASLLSDLEDHDPCGDNFETQVTFFLGSGQPSDSYPGLSDTPFCYGPGGTEAPCQNEMVASPVLDLRRYSTAGDENQDADIPPGELPMLAGIQLRYTVYRDNPLENLVFYYWRVRNIINGCAMPWQDRDILYYGDEATYFFETHDFSHLVTSDSIQVAVGLVDMCDLWYGIKGDCAEHTPAPWFDNIKVVRYATVGPQWSYRDFDLFQDNFPSDEYDIESYVRADMAMDINAGDDPTILPGDSIVVSCASPAGGGIAEDAYGPRVYMHVRVKHLGPDSKTPPSGMDLEGSYGLYAGMEGDWTVIQGDTARAADGSPAPGTYMFDLNDSLLTRGFMVEYYFKAFDNNGESATLPSDAQSLPDEGYYFGSSYFFEFTCLPTLNSDMLYVDDYHGHGTRDGIVQNHWDATFQAVVWDFNYPDRYDVNGPTSLVSNGPGSRAKDAHLAQAYDFIIWDSGDLSAGTICDGTADSDKSNDCRMLIDWLNLTASDRTLWVLGNNIASDLDRSTSLDALILMNTWCGVTLVHESYYGLTGGSLGGTISPEVLALPGVDPFNVADTICVFGGCPSFDDFDVLGTTGIGEYALQYPDYDDTDYYAAVKTVHDHNGAKQTMWFGFSIMHALDCRLPAENMPVVRNTLLSNMIYWHCKGTGCTPIDITGTETPHIYSLAQNYPNPFNPLTAIRYSVKNRDAVTLKIYDVTGRLVRTLVNEIKEPGAYTVAWDGYNDRGAGVASGIYFYRLAAGDFVQTRKMVLLR
ncbi:MAG: T9SS type A sorting domain-containing protein [bacterium]|nr:MAG: T9SS type A sorting domain-containing protein [bacterium]